MLTPRFPFVFVLGWLAPVLIFSLPSLASGVDQAITQETVASSALQSFRSERTSLTWKKAPSEEWFTGAGKFYSPARLDSFVLVAEETIKKQSIPHPLKFGGKVQRGDVVYISWERQGNRHGLALVCVAEHSFAGIRGSDGKVHNHLFFIYPYGKRMLYNTFPPRIERRNVRSWGWDDLFGDWKVDKEKDAEWLDEDETVAYHSQHALHGNGKLAIYRTQAGKDFSDQVTQTGKDFFDQVKDHFAEWDQDGNGNLSAQELYRLVDKPAIQGKQAAAVAALVRVVRAPNPPTEMTQDYFATLAKHHPNRQPDEPPFAEKYLKALQHIKNTKQVLFVDGDPSLKTFHQGALGDCFFLAPLGAVVARNPGDVRTMINQNPDSSYTITFTQQTPIQVAGLTDTEIALSSGTAGHGLWINVLEKAFATYQNQQSPKDDQKESVLEVISLEGNTGKVIKTLTGHEAKVVHIRKEDNLDVPPEESERPKIAQNVQKKIVDTLGANRLVCATTPSEVVVPGLTAKHAFAVVKYDADQNVIRLWNPHGNTFTPNGDAGLMTGYPTKAGFFQMPLDDFVQVFRRVFVEAEE